jgi:putative membrane protein
MWLKVGGVGFLVIYHLQCGRYVNAIYNNSNQHGHVFYRFFNEVPVLFLFGIVILAVLKPF